MAKKLFDIKLECFQANRNKNGSQITLSGKVETTERGPASRQAVNIVDPDSKLSSLMTPGKKYTVTVTED